MIKNYPTLKNLVPLFFLLFSVAAFSQTYNTTVPGPGFVTVPPGVTQVTVEVWGGGGGGGSATSSKYSAGGGGGGAYTIAVIEGLVAGQRLNYIIGIGGNYTTVANGNGKTGGVSSFSSEISVIPVISVIANGGNGGGNASSSAAGLGGAGGAGGTRSGGAGYSGRNNSPDAFGGGGGSSAGTDSDGNTAIWKDGASAVTGGGAGGDGAKKNNSASPVTSIGGGGGGSGDAKGTPWDAVGGKGGDGQVRITWTYLNFNEIAKNDYIDFGNSHSLTSNFSLEAWVLEKVRSTTSTIISKRDAKIGAGNQRGYHLSLNNGYPNLTWFDNAGNAIINITSSIAIPINVWHHLTATFDGTTAKLYSDGILVANATTTTSPTNGTEKFLIGAMFDSSTATPKNNFDGYIDEVRVWNVALTLEQIREMMNQRIIQNGTAVRGKTIPLDILGGLVWSNLNGYYPMNDSHTASDKSGNVLKINGSIKNMVTIQPNTAPLPYKSIPGAGNWDAATTWENSSSQYLPNTTINGTKIDWNIVETAHDITSGNRDITVLGLISTAGKLTIQDTGNIATGTAGTGQGLWITHYLKLNGLIDLVGESQLVQKRYGTYDKYGLLITTQLRDSDFDAASTGTIEIDQQGTGDSFNYNYWSSPVRPNIASKTYAIGDVLRDGNGGTLLNKNIDFGAPYAFADIAKVGTENIKLSTYWMYKLENSKGYAAWTRIRNDIPIKIGEGYTMKGSNTTLAEQNYTFVGTPNNGTIELAVNEGNEYLVGNPYPSALDADQFLIDNGPTGTNIIGIGSALHFWEHSGGGTHNLAGYQGGYATYNFSGGASAATGGQVAGVGTSANAKKIPRRYIPVGQAFFVVGDRAGDIKFRNNQRIFVKESQKDILNNNVPFSVFMKSANKKAKTDNTDLSDLRPKFRIGFDAPKISHRELLLTIDERATKEVDWGFDAEIFEIFIDDFYWMLDGKKYIIQGTNEVGLNSEVPLGIQLSKTGLVTVKIDALENVDDDTSIYLKDKVTGESFNMREKPVQLNLIAGKYADRFVLVFKTQKLVAEDVTAEILIPVAAQPIIEGIHVFMNNAISELQIKNNSTEEIVSVALINALGQTVKTWNSNFNIRTISLPLSTATGVYLVQINTKTGKTVKKISVE